MNVLDQIINAFAEPPMTATFDQEGSPMALTIRKVTLRDQEDIEAAIDKKFPDKDDAKRGMAMSVEIFRRALLDEDGTPAVKNDKDIARLKEKLGMKRGVELILFVTSKSMGTDEKSEGDEKKD
jgi:hypothetical protein